MLKYCNKNLYISRTMTTIIIIAVVARSGLETARYMECEYGIPYLVGIPIGSAPTLNFINAARSVLSMEDTVITADRERDNDINSALIIGEQVMSNSIRECLRRDIGIEKVNVASFLEMDEELKEEGDIYLEQENDLTALVDKGKYDLVVGDPLYKELLIINDKSNFVEFPHMALSSRLYWDRELEYVGEAGVTLFKKNIQK